MSRTLSSAIVRILLATILPVAAIIALAQTHDAGFTIEQIMSPAFPYGLVAARHADRIAWMEDERGMRNVYTAAAPDFKPLRITSVSEDNGVDLQSLQLSDDGSLAVFVRGHTANFKGQFGNQGSSPDGGRRDVWAAGTNGGRPAWRVVALQPDRAERGARGGGRGAGDIVLSPDGKWVLYIEDGQIHRAAVDPVTADPEDKATAQPFFVTLGVNSDPVWSPDSRKIAFVSDRYDQRQYFPTQGQVTTHSFITIYDLDTRQIS